MVNEILGKEAAATIMELGKADCLMEKSAKGIPVLDQIWEALKGYAALNKSMITYGGLAGIATGAGYNIIKDSLQAESPEAAKNRKVEAIYSHKARELEDADWMTRVRGMRDELARGYRKMPAKEYAEKYNALLAALDERKA